MTAVIAAPSVESQLAELSAQVAAIAEDLRRTREAREQWEELAATLVPVSRDAFDLASRELEDLSEDVSIDDAVRFARTLARTLPKLERLLAQLGSLAELGSELTSLSGAGLSRVSEVLADAERAGLFEAGRRVSADVTSPEVVALLPRLTAAMRRSGEASEAPPTLLDLLRALRDPQTRRGLVRAIELVRALGA